MIVFEEQPRALPGSAKLSIEDWNVTKMGRLEYKNPACWGPLNLSMGANCSTDTKNSYILFFMRRYHPLFLPTSISYGGLWVSNFAGPLGKKRHFYAFFVRDFFGYIYI